MICLDDYRNIQVDPNYEKPKLTKIDMQIGQDESKSINFVICVFLFCIGLAFAAIAYSLGTYTLSMIGVLWFIAYYSIIFIIAGSNPKQDGVVYLLIDKIETLDDVTGKTDCLFVVHNMEADVYHKVDVSYIVYRDARIGDWIFMYANRNNEFIIPEYPNKLWNERGRYIEKSEKE